MCLFKVKFLEKVPFLLVCPHAEALAAPLHRRPWPAWPPILRLWSYLRHWNGRDDCFLFCFLVVSAKRSTLIVKTNSRKILRSQVRSVRFKCSLPHVSDHVSSLSYQTLQSMRLWIALRFYG